MVTVKEAKKQKPLEILCINTDMDGQNQGEEVWMACDGIEGMCANR